MFSQDLKSQIIHYAYKDLPSEVWYANNFFPFIVDKQLRDRLVVEYKNARFIYKIFEGIQASDELLLAQVRTQVIMYVSIQEAVINYVLFELYATDTIVKKILKVNTYKEISIPTEKKKILDTVLFHNGKNIIPTYKDDKQIQKEKVRYEHKVAAVADLGLIDDSLKNDLIKLYEYRNTIHIEAEMKKKFDYDLDMSKLAYRRVEGLSIVLSASLK